MSHFLNIRPWRQVVTIVCCLLGMFSLNSAYATDKQPSAADETRLEEGKLLFQKDAVPACALCHALKDADAQGPIGPDLDNLQPNRDQILAVLRDGSGAMPSFEESLSQEQREAIADYVVWATSH